MKMASVINVVVTLIGSTMLEDLEKSTGGQTSCRVQDRAVTTVRSLIILSQSEREKSMAGSITVPGKLCIWTNCCVSNSRQMTLKFPS